MKEAYAGTIFNKISFWKVLFVVILFPTVIFTHLFNIFLPITLDYTWSMVLSAFVTQITMVILFIKLFTGSSFLKTLEYTKGTIFLILFFTVVYAFALPSQHDVWEINNEIIRAIAGEKSVSLVVAEAMFRPMVGLVIIVWMEFFGILAFFSFSSVVREGTENVL